MCVRASRTALAALLAVTALGFSASPAAAAVGGPDASFAGDGEATTDFSGYDDRASALLVRPDGRPVAGGSSVYGTGGFFGDEQDFAVSSYTPDGGLDKTFSGDGRQTARASDLRDEVSALTLQSDGKLVAAGNAGAATEPGYAAIARFNPDGSLDPSFSEDGRLDERAREFTEVADHDGGLVATATFQGAPGEPYEPFVFRYKDNGDPDADFGDDGRAALPFVASALRVDTEDRLLVSGSYPVGEGSSGLAVARLTPEGELDTSFSGDGIQSVSFGGGLDEAEALAVSDTGEILLAGADRGATTEQFAVARLDSAGEPDPSFSDDGKQTVGFGDQDAYARELTVLSGGAIAIAGQARQGDQLSLAQARLDPLGAPDTSFGSGGRALTPVAAEEINGIGIQPDGRIVAAGSRDGDFAVARYTGDGESTDLSLTQTDSPDPATNGETITYSLTATNEDADPATGAKVVDELPEGADFVSSSDPAACSHSSGTVTCSFAALAPATERRVDITVRPRRTGTLSNYARVTGDQQDGVLDNEAREETEVGPRPPRADLGLDALAPVRVQRGQRIAYTFTAANRGPQGARAATLGAELSSGQRFVAASEGCSYRTAARSVICELGNLPNGQRRRVGITVAAEAARGVDVEAALDSETADPDRSDNSVTETSSVQPASSKPSGCTIVGSAGNDVIEGSPGRDVVCAADGGDVVRGQGGDDVLRGGLGSDTLTGQAGDDRLLGEGGHDLLVTRDGVRANDSADGGFGRDTCRRDPGDARRSCP